MLWYLWIQCHPIGPHTHHTLLNLSQRTRCAATSDSGGMMTRGDENFGAASSLALRPPPPTEIRFTAGWNLQPTLRPMGRAARPRDGLRDELGRRHRKTISAITWRFLESAPWKGIFLMSCLITTKPWRAPSHPWREGSRRPLIRKGGVFRASPTGLVL